MSEAGEDYDIAFIEGSITTDNDVKRIKRDPGKGQGNNFFSVLMPPSAGSTG